MQLSRFRAFLEELSIDQNLLNFAQKISIFRYWDESWYDENNDLVKDADLIDKLQDTLIREKHWRYRKNTIAFFPIAVMKAVAVVQFFTVTTTKTRSNFQNAIDTCLGRSEKSFDATHDILTGLLNNAAFIKKATQAIGCLEPQHDEKQSVGTGPIQGRNIILIAIDVDHFKQVNDAYGHVYGDLVIQTLGQRFESLTQLIRKERVGDIEEIQVARPSGEEFLVLVVGILDIDSAIILGDLFRQKICSMPLPSDDEWRAIQSTTDETDIIQPPPLSERIVTISIGIASVSTRHSLPPKDPVQVLRDRADRALYCAKSGGRNTVRHFDEILTKYGLVIEHRGDVDVVIIDIGRDVNVQKGQEFIVYHPQFRGQVPYYYDDGRTRRVLGICPKVPIGRIVAFDIQPEISFCRVEERKYPELFGSGSVLEAIPLGSISHLVSQEVLLSEGDFSFKTPREITSICKGAEKEGIQPMAVVLSIKNEKSLMDARGSVFVNQCLANLYEVIRNVFPDTIHIVKVRDTEFAVVWQSTDSKKMLELSKEAISKAALACKGRAEFRSGFYLGEKNFNLPGDSSQLSWEWSLDYADFAIAYAKLIEQDQSIFSSNTAEGLLYTLRRTKQFSVAIKDYKELIQRGVNYYKVEIQASLCAWEMPNRNLEIVTQASQRAIDLNPEESVVWANSAFFLYYLSNYPEAYQRIRKIFDMQPNYEIIDVYLYPFADTIHRAYLAKTCDLSASWIRELLEYAKTKAEKAGHQSWFAYFVRALESHIVTDQGQPMTQNPSGDAVN